MSSWIPATTTAALLSTPLVVIIFIVGHMAVTAPSVPCPTGCDCFEDQAGFLNAKCSLNSFKVNPADDFYSVQLLTFNNSDLTMPVPLRDGMFQMFTGVVNINLSNCSVGYIYPGAFKGLKFLQELDLSNNRITHFHRSTFNTTSKLSFLNLNNNPLEITKVFVSSRSLQELKLESCSIQHIPAGAFRNLPKLKRLSLYNNSLDTIPANTIPRHVKHLSVAKNHIVNVPTEVIYNLKRIRSIDLSENPINCSCKVLGLEDWLSDRAVIFENDVLCESPLIYRGKSWNTVNEDEVCVEEIRMSDDMDNQVLGQPHSLKKDCSDMKASCDDLDDIPQADQPLLKSGSDKADENELAPNDEPAEKETADEAATTDKAEETKESSEEVEDKEADANHETEKDEDEEETSNEDETAKEGAEKHAEEGAKEQLAAEEVVTEGIKTEENQFKKETPAEENSTEKISEHVAVDQPPIETKDLKEETEVEKKVDESADVQPIVGASTEVPENEPAVGATESPSPVEEKVVEHKVEDIEAAPSPSSEEPPLTIFPAVPSSSSPQTEVETNSPLIHETTSESVELSSSSIEPSTDSVNQELSTPAVSLIDSSSTTQETSSVSPVNEEVSPSSSVEPATESVIVPETSSETIISSSVEPSSEMPIIPSSSESSPVDLTTLPASSSELPSSSQSPETILPSEVPSSSVPTLVEVSSSASTEVPEPSTVLPETSSETKVLSSSEVPSSEAPSSEAPSSESPIPSSSVSDLNAISTSESTSSSSTTEAILLAVGGVSVAETSSTASETPSSTQSVFSSSSADYSLLANVDNGVDDPTKANPSDGITPNLQRAFSLDGSVINELKENLGPYVVLGCIILVLAVLLLVALIKCRKSPSKKRVSRSDSEVNTGTELQEITSLIPTSMTNGTKIYNSKYPNEKPSKDVMNLLSPAEDRESNGVIVPLHNDSNGTANNHNELWANGTKSNGKSCNGLSAPDSPESAAPQNNRGSQFFDDGVNPPIELTKVKVLMLPDSVPKTPLIVHRKIGSDAS